MKKFSGVQLRKIRLLRGYSLGMLSRLVEVHTGLPISRSTMSHWEHGRSCPRLTALVALSEVFEVQLDYFFELKTNKLFDKGHSSGRDRGDYQGRLADAPDLEKNVADQEVSDVLQDV